LALRKGDSSRQVKDYWDAMLDGSARLSVDPWYMPPAVARAEAAWLRGDVDAVQRVAVPALAAALHTDDPWRIGQLACWLKRIDRLPADFDGHVAPPCAAELGGDPHAA